MQRKGDFDMYTVRFQLELSESEQRFLSKSFSMQIRCIISWFDMLQID